MGARPRCFRMLAALGVAGGLLWASQAAPAAAAGAPIALGATTTGFPGSAEELDRYTAMVGQPPRVVMWYRDWRYAPFVAQELDAVAQRGALPMVTWEPWRSGAGPEQPDYAPRTIAAGAHDAYIREAARAAAAWGRPLFVRFAHEMNGGWYPWGAGVNGNSPADYVAAWRHVVQIFREEGATNVRWVWCPNVDSGPSPFAQHYPGDEWVDWVGLDGYNWSHVKSAPWTNVAEIFARSYDALTALGRKPVMIGETGSVEAGGDKAAWILHGLLEDVPARLPRVRAVLWFNRNYEAEWRVDTSEAALNAYRSVAGSGLYQGSTDMLLNPPIVDAEPAAPGGTAVPVAAVKLLRLRWDARPRSRLGVTLVCEGQAAGTCRARVELRMRSGSRARRRLLVRRVSVPANRPTTARLRLPSRLRARLARGSVPVEVIASLADAGGTPARRVVRLRAR